MIISIRTDHDKNAFLIELEHIYLFCALESSKIIRVSKQSENGDMLSKMYTEPMTTDEFAEVRPKLRIEKDWFYLMLLALLDDNLKKCKP